MSQTTALLSRTSSHLWVAAYPFVDTTLFMVPANPVMSPPEPVTAELYDADGNLANELAFEYPRGHAGVVELETVMGDCKLEGGFRHGHLVLRTPVGVSHYLRMNSREGAALIGEPVALGPERSGFFPLTIDDGRNYYVALVNHTKTPATVKCRLFCAKRSPEAMFTVPALGSRLLSLATQFAEYAELESGKQLQAYIRLSTKSDTTVGVQLIERLEGKSEAGFFYSVS